MLWVTEIFIKGHTRKNNPPDQAADNHPQVRVGLLRLKGPNPGNMTGEDTPQGSGTKGGRLFYRSGAGSAGNCVPQVAAMLADRQCGGPAPTSASKGRQHDPGLPERVSSICSCSRDPYVGSIPSSEHKKMALPLRRRSHACPPSHHPSSALRQRPEDISGRRRLIGREERKCFQ
jgi:hypothetical protein